MNFTLFTDFFKKIDSATAHFVTEMSSNSITTIAPMVGYGLTLSFIIFALLIMHGVIDMPLSEFLRKFIRIGIITGIALSGGIYQNEIAGILNTLPDDLSQSLIMNKGAGSNSSVGLIDSAFLHTFSLAGDAFNKARTLHIGSALGYSCVALCVTVTGGILFGIGV